LRNIFFDNVAFVKSYYYTMTLPGIKPMEPLFRGERGERVRRNVERSEIEDPITKLENTSPVIMIYAGPGAGKTTNALWLTAYLKTCGINVEFVGEYARSAIMGGNIGAVAMTQFYTLGKQWKYLMNMIHGSKSDFTIADASPLNSLFYATPDFDETDAQSAIRKLKRLNCLSFFLTRGEYELTLQGRSQGSVEELDVLADQTLEALNFFKIPHFKLTVDKYGQGHLYDMLVRIKEYLLLHNPEAAKKIRLPADKETWVIANNMMKGGEPIEPEPLYEVETKFSVGYDEHNAIKKFLTTKLGEEHVKELTICDVYFASTTNNKRIRFESEQNKPTRYFVTQKFDDDVIGARREVETEIDHLSASYMINAANKQDLGQLMKKRIEFRFKDGIKIILDTVEVEDGRGFKQTLRFVEVEGMVAKDQVPEIKHEIEKVIEQLKNQGLVGTLAAESMRDMAFLQTVHS
jgi:CYTH domain